VGVVEAAETPTVAKIAQVEVVTGRATVDQWIPLLKKHFGSQWSNALRVMACESGGRPGAIGPTDSKGYNPIGLMQIKNFAGRPSTEALKDGETNIQWAAGMQRAQGWGPWECAYKLGIK
jgi:soluble lytic murein transglycosylase-like protein